MVQLILCDTAAEGKLCSLGYLKYPFHNPIKKKKPQKRKKNIQNENKTKMNLSKTENRRRFKSKDYKNPQAIEPTYALTGIKS